MRTTALCVALSIALLSTVAWADESDLVWSTFLGGCDDDWAAAIALSNSGYAYVTGMTISPDFPATTGAFDATHNGMEEGFVAKLDPTGGVLEYATFLGGNNYDWGRGIVLDSADNVYVTGQTGSVDFPATVGAFDETYNGYGDAFVVKLNPAGSEIEYATFLGGSNDDEGWAIDLDDSDHAYLTGSTASDDFPATTEAVDRTHNGGDDIFVVKVMPSGSDLAYSTFLGGSDDEFSWDIAVEGSGSAYVIGNTESDDFPTTAGAFDTTHNGGHGRDAFVAKLDATGSAMTYSTFLGGSDEDGGHGIVVDDSGNANVIGETRSADFPVTAGVYDTTHNGNKDVFAAKLNLMGSALIYSTFLGAGGDDRAFDIALDSSGNLYVTGGTYSDNFPITDGAFDTIHNGFYDIFVAKISATGSTLIYSTFLGGPGQEYGFGIALDGFDDAHVTGWTGSPDFPATAGAFDTTYGGFAEAFVIKLANLVDQTPPEAIDDLTIALQTTAKSTAGDICLWWTEPYDNMGVTRYVIYRNTVIGSLGDSLAGTTDTTYTDESVAGDLEVNYFYTVKAVDGAGNKSQHSNRVGEFDRRLTRVK